jgi:hypothetical protein
MIGFLLDDFTVADVAAQLKVRRRDVGDRIVDLLVLPLEELQFAFLAERAVRLRVTADRQAAE